MKRKCNLGIMTFYAVQNYGAALQAFALQQKLQELGANSELLKFYDLHNERDKNHSVKVKYPLSFRIKAILKNIINIKRRLYINKKYISNALGFNDFKTKYLQISNAPFYTFEDLIKANTQYDAFITGSDMVWTPIGQNLKAYFLQFADKNKRFSYAPSITGCQNFTEDEENSIKRYLEEFNLISCREREGVDYVKRMVKRDAVLVLDPTLLLSKDEWVERLSLKSKNMTKPYALIYMFGSIPRQVQNNIFSFGKRKNLEIRYIPLSEKQILHEIKFQNNGPIGPREFVDMFCNASFIFTNTFHGLLFSLIFEKPFVVYKRESGNKWKANETRITDLLSELGLNERFLDISDRFNDNYCELNYTDINKVIGKKKSYSIDYLKNVLSLINTDEQDSHSNV